MGARALALDRPEIAIHGTTRAMRASIGTAASYGCIRMRNEDVIDLYDRVRVERAGGDDALRLVSEVAGQALDLPVAVTHRIEARRGR